MSFDRLSAWFERGVSAALMLGMVVVILLAGWSFLRTAFDTVLQVDGPLDYPVFQTLFDRLLAAIIALELAHTVQQMVVGRRGFTQVRTVLVIGVLAVVRKLVLLDVDAAPAMLLVGLAAAILALGATFAALSWVQSRTEERLPSPGSDE